jgi:hypothetical protein
MTRNRHLFWKLGVAVLSLTAAVSVYCFARINPPEIFLPFQATNHVLASFDDIFGSAPSFFYTLALGLVVGVGASSHISAKLHVLIWTGLCSSLELTQIPVLSKALMTSLPGMLPEQAWQLVGPYWQRGIFDPVDLLATLFGGLIALSLVTRLPTDKNHAVR